MTLGYSPNATAQSMRLGATKTVGIVISHLNAPFLADWVSAAQDVFHSAGYATLLGTYTSSREREIDVIQALLRRRVDALLLSSSSELDKDLLALLKETQVPIVLIDRELPEWADSVTVNHRGATRRSIDFLIKLGHRRIGAILGGEAIYPSRERLIGYRTAHQEAGVPIDPQLVGSDFFLPDYGFSQTLELFRKPSPPTAIISGGLPLPGVLRALRELRLRIPDDVSLVATSESDLTELMTPPLSCESWNAPEVGSIAAQIALERMRNGSTEARAKRVTIPSDFVVRDSCGVPARAVEQAKPARKRANAGKA